MRSRIALAALAAILLTVVGAVAVLASIPTYAAERAQRVPLLVNPVRADCTTGATEGGVPSDAYATISFSGDKSVTAQVTVRDGIPNTTYGVNLIQTPSGENCNRAEATLTTNRHGQGSAKLSEPLLSGTDGAWVQLFTPPDATGNFTTYRVTVGVPVK